MLIAGRIGEDRVGLVLADLQPGKRQRNLAQPILAMSRSKANDPTGPSRGPAGVARPARRPAGAGCVLDQLSFCAEKSTVTGGSGRPAAEMHRVQASRTAGRRRPPAPGKPPMRQATYSVSGRHRGADGREDVAVRHADGQRAASAHRHAAEINAVAVDLIPRDHPLNGVEDPFLGRRNPAANLPPHHSLLLELRYRA